MFSHYADKNGPESQVLYIAAGTVLGVLLIVAIVTAVTVTIVVCCKKCKLTKGHLCKRLSPSTAAVDSKNMSAESTRVQEPQVKHKVREHHTVYNNVCVAGSAQAVLKTEQSNVIHVFIVL